MNVSINAHLATKPEELVSVVPGELGFGLERVIRGVILSRMFVLADQGDAGREDTGCGVLYGVLRDSAYKLRQLAELEKEAHEKKGWWK